MSHGLKKGFIGMMWMVCAAVISACSPSPAAEPAVLPPEEQRTGFRGRRDGVAADCGNQEQIGELLDSLLKSGEAPLNDRIPMVMADGAMYYDTGRESTVTADAATWTARSHPRWTGRKCRLKTTSPISAPGMDISGGRRKEPWKYAWMANGWYLSGGTWMTIGFILREDGMIKADCRRILSGGLRGTTA